MTIKHISFDVWNTLVTANERYAYERTEIISYFAGISPREAGEAYREIKKVLDADAANMVCGDEYHAWWVLGRHLGVDRKAAEKMKMYCEKAFIANPPHLNEDLVDQLIYLSFNYELSIKSNTNFVSGRILSEAVGFDRMPWWSFIHFSDEHMLCKPDILFFAKTLLESNLDELSNYEILHVGDSEIFDGKCVDLGFKFCHVKNPQDLLEKLEKGEIINA
jgi:putative hydrolase of the HAD superfamily|nr:MAG TPA: putative hydrolase [Caudoviricetes sp.]